MRDDLQERLKPAENRSTDGSGSTYPSVAALAAEVGLSERSTRNALRRGEIPHIRIGRRFILPRAAIAEWLRTAGRSLASEQGSTVGGVSKRVASPGHPEVTVMTRAAGRQ